MVLLLRLLSGENVTSHTYEYNDLGYPVKVDKETVYEFE